VNKISQFAVELANPNTTAPERLMALQFILHFVGDLHQPLHSSDNHDRGGNDVKVTAQGTPENNLHHYWDVVFVEMLGKSQSAVAADLAKKITAAQKGEWQKGTPDDWAQEAFQQAKDHAYGKPVMTKAGGPYHLSAAYVTDAKETVALQLSKAGVRLAAVLNHALGGSQ
jgi:hypothetical protein